MTLARTPLASLAALAAVLILLVTTAGCDDVSKAAGQAPTPVPGGTYVVPLLWDPPSIEPLNTYDSESVMVNNQVFQGLVRWETGSDGIVRGVPGLAESWSASDDATVWTFRLKKGVRFQPPVSREVTARDVVADWNYVTDPANESAVQYTLGAIRGADATGYAAKGLTGLKALDRYTLQVTLKFPFADFPLLLGQPRDARLAGRLHEEGRSGGLPQETGRHGAVHGRPLGPRRVHRPREEPRLLGPGARGPRRHGSTCRSWTSRPSGRSSRRGPSTSPPYRRSR